MGEWDEACDPNYSVSSPRAEQLEERYKQDIAELESNLQTEINLRISLANSRDCWAEKYSSLAEEYNNAQANIANLRVQIDDFVKPRREGGGEGMSKSCFWRLWLLVLALCVAMVILKSYFDAMWRLQ